MKCRQLRLAVTAIEREKVNIVDGFATDSFARSDNEIRVRNIRILSDLRVQLGGTGLPQKKHNCQNLSHGLEPPVDGRYKWQLVQ